MCCFLSSPKHSSSLRLHPLERCEVVERMQVWEPEWLLDRGLCHLLAGWPLWASICSTIKCRLIRKAEDTVGKGPDTKSWLNAGQLWVFLCDSAKHYTSPCWLTHRSPLGRGSQHSFPIPKSSPTSGPACHICVSVSTFDVLPWPRHWPEETYLVILLSPKLFLPGFPWFSHPHTAISQTLGIKKLGSVFPFSHLFGFSYPEITMIIGPGTSHAFLTSSQQNFEASYYRNVAWRCKSSARGVNSRAGLGLKV